MSFKKGNKIFLFGSLYFVQFIPLGFFSETMPVFLRTKGYGLEIIGMVHLLLLPWMVKFLWAPLVDRIGARSAGHYKYWIVVMQVLSAIALAGLYFTGIDNLNVIFIFILLVSLFSSTQDIATDALAVESLKKEEQGVINGIQNASHFLGSMIGGGILLIVLNIIGWENTILCLSVLMLVPLISVFIYKKKTVSVPRNSPGGLSYIKFFKKPGNISWIVLLALLPLGAAIADFALKPLLVDLGYSLESIGIIRGFIGLGGGFLGAITGGFLIKSFGRKKLLINFGILNAAAVLLYLIPLFSVNSFVVIAGINFIAKFAGGMFLTVIYTMVMEKSSVGTAGSDFTLQIAVLTLSSHGISAPIGGLIANYTGYSYVFLTAAITAFGSLIGAYYIVKERSGEPDEIAVGSRRLGMANE